MPTCGKRVTWPGGASATHDLGPLCLTQPTPPPQTRTLNRIRTDFATCIRTFEWIMWGLVRSSLSTDLVPHMSPPRKVVTRSEWWASASSSRRIAGPGTRRTKVRPRDPSAQRCDVTALGTALSPNTFFTRPINLPRCVCISQQCVKRNRVELARFANL